MLNLVERILESEMIAAILGSLTGLKTIRNSLVDNYFFFFFFFCFFVSVDLASLSSLSSSSYSIIWNSFCCLYSSSSLIHYFSLSTILIMIFSISFDNVACNFISTTSLGSTIMDPWYFSIYLLFYAFFTKAANR